MRFCGTWADGRGRRSRPGNKPGEVITRPDRSERWLDGLKVGSVAPDFTLPLLHKEGEQAKPTGNTSAALQPENTISLANLRAEQPVVLVFGSITGPPFRGQLEGIDAVYEQYQDRARFLFVYIREAHPDSLLSVVQPNGQESLLKIIQPTDPSTRTQAAALCQRTAKLNMLIAVDTIDNSVGKAYAGWLDRMVVVGTDGKILIASDPAPRGTDAARLRTWLEDNL